MISMLKIYSTKENEILQFLESFFGKKIDDNINLYWEKTYDNPVEMSDIIAAFVDNPNYTSNSNMWVSIDKGVFIK